ncbi:hypothetical protein [Brevibacterium atlanticum]|uniref:hypothetical protein n=1 Tax=Brevibacterium atlanticum TaxID=2697563 RepID=UPI001421FAFE|nr:hypothetical protein [Brevibacterium atlanticum]
MSRQRLYPFPRLTAGDLDWGDWTIQLNGSQTTISAISEDWDSNSVLTLGTTVRANTHQLSSVGVRNPKLALSVACPSTAFSSGKDVQLQLGQSSMTAEAEVTVEGSLVSQVLTVRAQVIGDDESEPLLRRRIVAEGPTLRLPLDTELDGFPTSSYSFDKQGMPEAPWRLLVSADELEAPFAHSIRLELNEDFAPVRKLISGNPDPHVAHELDAAIVRVLIATAARLSSGNEPQKLPEEVAAEYPDSVAAAAQRASEQYLRLPLSAAVKSYRLAPEKLEYDVAAGTRMLKD